MRLAELWVTFIVPLAAASMACRNETATLHEANAPAAGGAQALLRDPAVAATPADIAQIPQDAERLPSGLAFRVMARGQGKEHPRQEDRVKVHYSGWSRSGKKFEGSAAPGEPLLLRVSDGIAAWREVLPLMVAGEKRRLWAPSRLAYGDTAPVAPGDVVFDLELVGIVRPPEVPNDLATPPKTAKVTATGLTYRVLQAGTGSVHPTASSRVKVSYSGWTPDGRLFDSSVARGEPAVLPMDEVVKGFAEGVALMVVGDRLQLWIPAQLGYGRDQVAENTPSGPLVFDVELLEIK